MQAALDASHDGDTIKVAAGTFAGGVTIAKSVSVIGAGAGATTIRGGGPVVTVGEEGDASAADGEDRGREDHRRAPVGTAAFRRPAAA